MSMGSQKHKKIKQNRKMKNQNKTIESVHIKQFLEIFNWADLNGFVVVTNGFFFKKIKSGQNGN